MNAPIVSAAGFSPASTALEARDYARVVRAIAYLRSHATEQPGLAEIARYSHLSEHHFQRLFTRWAGVSPKRFLQFLTVEHAKARLAECRDLLELADDVGLSGTGRLHDLFVTLEAMSPGEIRSRGAGLVIRYGIHDSPFGRCLVAATPRGVCALRFVENERKAEAHFKAEWPESELRRDAEGSAQLMRRIFEPLASSSKQPLALLVRGTNFQMKVWRALLAVPLGALTTYQAIAEKIGRPHAARAVGNAIGANPVAYLIPCHRVIRESGIFGRYRWGEDRKTAMLAWEAAQRTRRRT